MSCIVVFHKGVLSGHCENKSILSHKNLKVSITKLTYCYAYIIFSGVPMTIDEDRVMDDLMIRKFQLMELHPTSIYLHAC